MIPSTTAAVTPTIDTDNNNETTKTKCTHSDEDTATTVSAGSGDNEENDVSSPPVVANHTEIKEEKAPLEEVRCSSSSITAKEKIDENIDDDDDEQYSSSSSTFFTAAEIDGIDEQWFCRESAFIGGDCWEWDDEEQKWVQF